MNLRILMSILVLILSGCTPPPTPDVILPKATRNGVKITSSSQDFHPLLWWKKMHDPVLNQLIKEALEQNNQIQSAKATVLQAQAKLQQARFAWLPTLNAKGNSFIGGGWDSHFTPEGTLAQSQLLSKTGNLQFKGYYSGFVPGYSLNILQNINNNKLAKASLNMQQAVYESTRLSIISQVTGTYFMLLGQRAQLATQRQLIHDLKQVYQMESVRFKEGASDLSTLTPLQQRIASAEANIPPIESSMAQLENALQVLINRNPGPLLTHTTLSSLSIRGLIPSTLPSGILKHRPDIIIARENLNVSAANIGLAYANFFPDISLTGLLGAASADLSHLLTLSTNLWLAQAAASMTLLNGSAHEQVKASKAGYSAAYFNYIQTMRSAFADVDNSLTNQQKINEVYQQQLKAQHLAKASHRLALAKYNAGATDYKAVANASTTVDDATQNLNLAKMQQLDSIVELYQALAGG